MRRRAIEVRKLSLFVDLEMKSEILEDIDNYIVYLELESNIGLLKF